MNIVAILEDFRARLRADAALEAWCLDQYGSTFKTFIGLDERLLPEPGQPLIHLYPASKDTGLMTESKEHVIGITCSLYDEQMVDTGNPDDSQMRGVGNLETFLAMALAAVRNTGLDLIFKEIHNEYETVDFFPNFIGNRELTLEQDRAFRDDPYE